MNTVNALLAQSREREIARAAHHPSRLMAHELRLAGTTPAPDRDPASGVPGKVGPRRPGHQARAVLRALGGLRRLGLGTPE